MKQQCQYSGTYYSGPNCLIDALERKNAVTKVLIVSILVEERTLNSEELGARVFTEEMIEEVCNY